MIDYAREKGKSLAIESEWGKLALHARFGLSRALRLALAGWNKFWMNLIYLLCSHLNDDWTRLRLIFTSSLICLFSGFRSNIWTHESTVVISVWSGGDEWKTVQKTNVTNPSWWTGELAAATYRATAASCAWWWFSFFAKRCFSLRLEVSELMNEVT